VPLMSALMSVNARILIQSAKPVSERASEHGEQCLAIDGVCGRVPQWEDDHLKRG
jgi:hypothetical protein